MSMVITLKAVVVMALLMFISLAFLLVVIECQIEKIMENMNIRTCDDCKHNMTRSYDEPCISCKNVHAMKWEKKHG